MSLPKKDVIATSLVAVAGVLYLLWVTGSAPPGMSGMRATGIVILALGFAASALAVVPGFGQLLHGNKIYMTVTSLIGLSAAIGGMLMLVAESEAGLAVVIASMVVLWLIATIPSQSARQEGTANCGRQDAVVGQSAGQGDKGSAERAQT